MPIPGDCVVGVERPTEHCSAWTARQTPSQRPPSHGTQHAPPRLPGTSANRTKAEGPGRRGKNRRGKALPPRRPRRIYLLPLIERLLHKPLPCQWLRCLPLAHVPARVPVRVHQVALTCTRFRETVATRPRRTRRPIASVRFHDRAAVSDYPRGGPAPGAGVVPFQRAALAPYRLRHTTPGGLRHPARRPSPRPRAGPTPGQLRPRSRRGVRWEGAGRGRTQPSDRQTRHRRDARGGRGSFSLEPPSRLGSPHLNSLSSHGLRPRQTPIDLLGRGSTTLPYARCAEANAEHHAGSRGRCTPSTFLRRIRCREI